MNDLPAAARTTAAPTGERRAPLPEPAAWDELARLITEQRDALLSDDPQAADRVDACNARLAAALQAARADGSLAACPLASLQALGRSLDMNRTVLNRLKAANARGVQALFGDAGTYSPR